MLIKDEAPAKCERISGSTVGWNQLISGKRIPEHGLVISYVGGVLTVNGTADSNYIPDIFSSTIYGSHKIMMVMTYISGSVSDPKAYFTDGLTRYCHIDTVHNAVIIESYPNSTRVGIGITQGSGVTFIDYKIVPQLFDLTQMFGTDAQICKALRVPDLTTEANKTLAIANFKKLFPLEYYAYDPGRLLDTRMIGKWAGWNQLCGKPTTAAKTTLSGTLTKEVKDGVVYLDGTPASTTCTSIISGPKLTTGHIYQLFIILSGGSITNPNNISAGLSNVGGTRNTFSGNKFRYCFSRVSAINSGQVFMDIPSTCTCNNAQLIVQIYDLTAIFGAGNEPSTSVAFETWMHNHGLDPDTYQPYTTSSSLLPSRIACTMPQRGQIACVDDSNPTNIKRYLKWPSEMIATDKNNAVGVVFAVDDRQVYITGNGNETTKQWSCVADYEITAIPSASGTYAVKLNNVAQGDMTYTRSEGTKAEFTVQLEAFLRGCDASSKAAKWEAYVYNNTENPADPKNGKCYLQMWNYNEYENTVTIAGCTLVKLVGKELAEFTTTMLHNQVGQNSAYCGFCRDRLAAWATNNTDANNNPTTRMNGTTQLYATFPCSKAYYDGALGDGLRANFATYGDYLDACMAKIDKTDTGIMHYWNGQAQTFLLSLKDIYVRGVKKAAYPAAEYALGYNAGKAGFTAGSWWLPSMYELGLLMKDIKGDKSDLVNQALTALGWQTISTNVYRWSCCRYYTTNAWSYSSIGISSIDFFYFSFRVSVVSAFNISDFVYDAPADSSTSSTLFLPQADTDIILRSAGNVRDEIVGNKIIRRVGTVDMGTLGWDYRSGVYFNTFELRAIAKPPIDRNTPYGCCSKYKWSFWPYNDNKSYSIDLDGEFKVIDNSYNTPAAFKAAMSGVYLNYELATPYTETLPDNWEKHFTAYNQGTETLLPENLSYPYTSPIKLKNRYKNIEIT